MKTVRIIFTMRLTEEGYKEEALIMKKEIESGKFQRDIKDNRGNKQGVLKVTATFETLK